MTKYNDVIFTKLMFLKPYPECFNKFDWLIINNGENTGLNKICYRFLVMILFSLKIQKIKVLSHTQYKGLH